MASQNPYPIDNYSVEDVNNMIKNNSLSNELLLDEDDVVKRCDCGVDFSNSKTLDAGDKWSLRICVDCKGLFGRHHARADYY